MKNKITREKTGEKGFSLLECVIAICLITVGLLAVAALAAVATQGEVFAINSTDAAGLAAAKMEELKAGALTNGGSLTGNAAGYSDTPGFNFYRRWTIADGPAGTKEIVVRVVPQVASSKIRATQLRTLVR